MYNNVLRIHNEYFAKEQTLPTGGASAVGNGGAMHVAGLQGKAEVLLCASGEVSLAKDSVLTLTLEHGEEQDSLAAMPQQFCQTFTAAVSAKNGDILALLPVPSNALRYAQAKVNVTGTASGKMDIFLNYLPA